MDIVFVNGYIWKMLKAAWLHAAIFVCSEYFHKKSDTEIGIRRLRSMSIWVFWITWNALYYVHEKRGHSHEPIRIKLSIPKIPCCHRLSISPHRWMNVSKICPRILKMSLLSMKPITIMMIMSTSCITFTVIMHNRTAEFNWCPMKSPANTQSIHSTVSMYSSCCMMSLL